MIPNVFAHWLLVLSVIGQATVPDGGVKATAAERLQFMKESVRAYEMSVSGQAGTLKLQTDPAFRLGNQGGDNVVDGGIFLWTAENGRPEVAVQAFLIKPVEAPEGLWVHEFTSLAAAPLTATRHGRTAWSPITPGVVFRPLPDAPAPGRTSAQRQRQMRELAKRFKASDDFHRKGWCELRLLPTPVATYGKAGSQTLDGAHFALVLGTDPEVFLFLEARPGSNGLEWHYALAPMTVFELKVSYQEKPIWSLPNREPANDASRPFFDTTFIP